MEKLPARQQAPLLQSMCREWVWEYILKHCTNKLLIRALLHSYPIPPHSLSLKRLVLLKSLSLDVVDEDRFSERTLEILSELSSSVPSPSSSSISPSPSSLSALCVLPRRFHAFSANKGSNKGEKSFSFSELLLAVRVECTIQHLRKETEDWPKFHEVLHKLWTSDEKVKEKSTKNKNTLKKHGNELRLEKKEEDDDDDEEEGSKDRFFKLKEDLHDVMKKPRLRHGLLRRFNREKVRRMVQGFVSEVWESLGSVFLEKIADNVKKGLYLPEEVSPSSSLIAREETRMGIELSDSEAKKDVDNVLRRKSSGKISLGKNLGSVSDGKTLNNISWGQNVDNASTKNNVEGRPSATIAVIEEKDGYKDTEGSSSPIQGKRKIPRSLKEKPKESLLSSSKIGDVQLIKEMQVKASNFRRPVKEQLLKTTHINGSNGKLVEEAENAVSTTKVSMPNEQEGGDRLVCLSPPPWTESPTPGSAITIRSKRRKIGAFLFNEDHASGMTPIRRNILNSVEIRKAQAALIEVQESLNAVVKDPLPEAIKIAEEAVAKSSKPTSKVSGCLEETLNLIDRDQGQTSRPPERDMDEVNAISPVRMRGSEKAFGERQSRSIMDRNPTARTIEWGGSDDLNESPVEDDSPSCSRKVRLPTLRARESIMRMKGVPQNLPHRRKIRRWTLEEENILRSEVERYGKGHWKHILQKHSMIFENRTEVDLKDKWRNIEKREGI